MRCVRRLGAILLALALAILPLAPTAFAQTIPRTTLRDYDVVNGHYFTQTGGSSAEAGYAITDEGGIPLWSEFQRLGGVPALGYPVSRRFTWKGFTAGWRASA